MIKDILIAFFSVITVLDIYYINKFKNRIQEIDRYYDQDRSKRLRDLQRLEKRISHVDSKLRQRIHKDECSVKEANRFLYWKIRAIEGNPFNASIVLPDVTKLQEEMNGQS